MVWYGVAGFPCCPIWLKELRQLLEKWELLISDIHGLERLDFDCIPTLTSLLKQVRVCLVNGWIGVFG